MGTANLIFDKSFNEIKSYENYYPKETTKLPQYEHFSQQFSSSEALSKSMLKQITCDK